MSFHLYQGNSLEALAIRLAELLKINPDPESPPDPFAEPLIVVPNQGLSRWLSLRIAEINGLSPSIDFPFPGAFLYNYVFNPMQGITDSAATAESDLPFAPATVQWHILKILAELESEPAFERVRAFVAHDSFRRYQLAERLAQLFDRYMTYRPDLLYAWEENLSPIAGEDAEWQRQLWLKLIEANADGTPHFSALYQQFILATAGHSGQPDFLMPLFRKRRIFYFGVAPLPPAHLDILTRVASAEGFDIHFFTVNPCREEWSGAASSKAQLRDRVALVWSVGEELAANYTTPTNPLLGSTGRSGGEFFSLLLAYDNIIDHRDFFVLPASTSILATLQREIINNLLPEGKVAFEKTDHSITIHACHSPMREVEVLHDQLLSVFQELPDLAPRSISIYTPDIETYAPYIDAVFGQIQPGNAGHIPYVIADKSLLREYAECKAFLALLKVATGRFKASDVLGLLQNAPIRDRFNLTEDDLSRLGVLLKKVNLAWGLDADFRAAQGASAVYVTTWQFALERLILGAAMWDTSDAADALTVDDNACIPCHAAEGNASLIGSLADLLTALKELHLICTQATNRSAASWHAELSGMLARFFAQADDAPYGVILMQRTLDDFKRYFDNADCANLALPFATLFDWIEKQLQGAPGSERFVTGRVTFTRFQPMRNVPARVVGMLGMNDGAFPRNASSLSFDLMDSRTNRRVGDTLTRDADRYAFLETLMAAQERIIITYTGQSESDNKTLPPSVLVSELIDTVAASAVFPADNPAARALTVNHPLHPFSPEYFKDQKSDQRLVSFSESYYKVAENLVRGSIESDTEAALAVVEGASATEATSVDSEERVISLDALIRFFRSPCRYFYNQQLGVYLDIRSAELPSDEEPLELDTLGKYAFQSDLIKQMETTSQMDEEAQRALVRWEAEGRVAPGSQKTMAESAAVVRDLLQKKEALNLGASLEKEAITIALNPDIQLRGTLSSLYTEQQLLFLRPAREKGKDIVDAGLTHLAACASGMRALTHTIATDTTSVYRAVEPAEALHALNQIVSYFINGQRHPLCFDPEIGWKIVTGEEEKITEGDWSGDQYKFGVDLYLRRAFGEVLPARDSPAWGTLKEMSAGFFESIAACRSS